jgi:GNAT superfamily N-acetyltransferase
MSIRVRRAAPDDAEAFARLRRLVMPYQVITADGTRHMWQTAAPQARMLALVAEADGQVVGIGRAMLSTWTSATGMGSALVMVHPEHRGRGIGGQVYQRVEEHLREVGASRVQGWADDTAQAARWCERRGFARTHESRISGLDLADLPPPPPVPVGVSTVCYAELGPRVVYEVDAATMRDEPGDVTYDAVPYDDWFRNIWQRPESDPEVSTVVLVDGVPAAITTVEADYETGVMWSGGTGTLREYRGRGLAKLAKSTALRRAAAVGITKAYTGNDESNRPMLAVNEWLGYRPCATHWSAVKSLPSM